MSKVVVCGAALWIAACGSKQAAAPAVDPLLGAWCLQSEAQEATGPRKVVGSKWELRSDGTYSYAYKWHRWDERWSRAGDALDLGKLGAHKIERLEPSALELSQGGAHKYFGRDCGLEYAKAEQVHVLVDAAGTANPAKVEEALSRGASIDGLDILGVIEQTALIAAVRAHDVAMVQLLLSRGAKHDVAIGGGITAMSAAELAGYLDIVELLLKAGAKPSAKMAPPRKPTAQELEDARVRVLLDLDPGALTNRDAPPAAAPAAAPALPALAKPAPTAQAEPAKKPEPEPEPKPEPTKQEKEAEELKKQLCAQRPANLDALTPEMTAMLEQAGMSPSQYLAQQKLIFEQTCK